MLRRPRPHCPRLFPQQLYPAGLQLRLALPLFARLLLRVGLCLFARGGPVGVADGIDGHRRCLILQHQLGALLALLKLRLDSGSDVLLARKVQDAGIAERRVRPHSPFALAGMDGLALGCHCARGIAGLAAPAVDFLRMPEGVGVGELSRGVGTEVDCGYFEGARVVGGELVSPVALYHLFGPGHLRLVAEIVQLEELAPVRIGQRRDVLPAG